MGNLDVLQSLDASRGDGAGFGVRHLVGKARDCGHELRQEGGGLVSVVDELAEVVSDDANAAFAFDLLLLTSAQQNGDCDGERWIVD